jgi:hypothetical protein
VLGVHEPFPLKDGEGVSDRHPGHPVVIDEFRFRGELLALPEPPAVDGLAHLVGDLPEDRAVTRGIERTEEAGRERGHVYSFRYLDERPSGVATVESLAIREGRGT